MNKAKQTFEDLSVLDVCIEVSFVLLDSWQKVISATVNKIHGKIKDKYEVILGFVTLIISLSAFKNELAKVSLPLGYTIISLADYFLYIVYCLFICLYLYIMENIAKDTKIGSWKIFDIIIRVAYFLFVFVLLTPLLLILNIIFSKLYAITAADDKLLKLVSGLMSAIIFGFLGGLLSEIFSSKLLKEKRTI